MAIKSIKVGNRWVGIGKPAYIIAEIGSNFDGKISQAKTLVKLAKKSGANAAKFQSFLTEKILSKEGFKKKTTFQKNWKHSVWDVYKNAEFPLSWHKEMFRYCNEIGIDFLSTPYYFEAVDELIKLNVPAIKIGSGEITNLEFLKYVAKTNKPIFLATGASTMKEVKNAISEIKKVGNCKIVIMQATTQYPAPMEQANLRVLETYKEEFNLNIGYSDHSTGNLLVLASIALGACVIEKHFTIDSNLGGPDHPHSMNSHDFRHMVDEIRLLEKTMGNGIKKIESCEKETKIIQRRGLWSAKQISKGEIFTKHNIVALRPEIGLSASHYKEIIGKKSKNTMKPYTPISSKDYY